jgi:hypothetical protein
MLAIDGRKEMKKAALAVAATVLLCAPFLGAQKAQTFTGEITDAACAGMGGHKAMLEKGETNKDCTLSCVKAGSKFVLYDGTKKMVYQLDDQKKPAAFAGAKVTVTGTLDAASGSIHVTDIAAAK